MADLPEGLLDAVKSYLNVTWQDDATNERLTGYIYRGMARLQNIAGAPLDFTVEEQPRALLFDYCRYANSQALEVFEKNFEAELLDLHLSTQAPVIEDLAVTTSTDSSGGYIVVTALPLEEGDAYVFQVGASLTVPARLDVCMPGSVWKEWDGGIIPASAGQEILIAEIDERYRAKRAGKVTAL